jgi:predicted ester cyclase
LVGLGVACQDKEAQAALAESKAQAELEARNVALVKTMLAEMDKGNPEALLKFYAPDAKYYFPSNNPKPLSREDEVAMAKMFYAAIPDLTHNIVDIFGVKDLVIVKLTAGGTHRAELEGIPPTGQKIEISALVICRIKDGLIVEEIEEADMLGLYQQLGMELKPKAPAK